MSAPTLAGTAVATLLTRDGTRIEVACPPGGDVLSAAQQAGHVLPGQCRSGRCGSCAGHVAGPHRLAGHDPSALPGPSELGEPALLCHTELLGDAVVHLPYAAERICDGNPPCRDGVVSALDHVGGQVVRLVLQLGPDAVGGTGLACEAGQFVEIELPGSPLRRAYSLAGTANWDGEVELYVRLHPGGHVSEWLTTTAQVGDRVLVHGPQGGFTLVETGLRPRWFVAGGTGIAPLLAMLRQMAELGDPHPTRLHLGAARAVDLVAVDAVAAVADQLVGGLTATAWVGGSDGSPGVGLPVRHGTPVDGLREDLAARAPGSDLPDLYLCGPPAMIDAARQAAAAAGLPSGHVRAERFA